MCSWNFAYMRVNVYEMIEMKDYNIDSGTFFFIFLAYTNLRVSIERLFPLHIQFSNLSICKHSRNLFFLQWKLGSSIFFHLYIFARVVKSNKIQQKSNESLLTCFNNNESSIMAKFRAYQAKVQRTLTLCDKLVRTAHMEIFLGW